MDSRNKQYIWTLFFLFLYYDKRMHNYFTNYTTPINFDTIVSPSGSLKPLTCQVTQVFQMQLLVTQFTIKMFRIGFTQLLHLRYLCNLGRY